MEFDRLNRWLSLAANLGLLAGLILVALQLNQTSELARAQLINEGNITASQVWAGLMGEKPAEAIAKSIESPSEMTFSEFMVVDAYLYTAMNIFYRNYELAGEGMFDATDWQQSIDSLGTWFLGNAFGRAWWEEEARHFFEPEFVAYIDQLLARTSNRDSEFYWMKIKARLTLE
jgi:hypothetical protein